MADEIVADGSHCNNIATDCPLEATQEAAAPKGQIVHRFVNNFHIHQGGGDGVKCGNCGAEKTCRHCNAAVGKHQCEVCGMWISDHRTTIAGHARVHTGERPHLCDRCGMAFKVTGHLIQHQRIHSGARPFVCNGCGDSFTQQASLENHMQSIHSSDRLHACQQCSKSFKLRKTLMDHYRKVHNCYYSCADCGEKLRTRNEFTDHAAKHIKDNANTDSGKNVGGVDDEDDGGAGGSSNMT